MELSQGGRWEFCQSQGRRRHVSPRSKSSWQLDMEKGKKKGSWKWERIKSERKLAHGHFRHRSCDINISFIFLKNEINCFPGTLKVIRTSCSCILPREWQWDRQAWGRTGGVLRHVHSLVRLNVCSKFRLSQTELSPEFSTTVTSGSN